MNPSFQKLFDELETQRAHLLKSVRHLTEEQFNKALIPGKWSVAQILSHLITAEKMSVAYVVKKMQGIHELSDSGWWEEVKISILKISQRLPGMRFKAPIRVVENTIMYRDYATIEKEWESVRGDFRNMLSKMTDDHRRKLLYKHPIAGYLNIKHCLIFFREHIIHHTPQIKRLINLK